MIMAQKSMTKKVPRACVALSQNNTNYFFYSIGAPDALVSLITPLSSTKKTRVPVVPLTAGDAVQVY